MVPARVHWELTQPRQRAAIAILSPVKIDKVVRNKSALKTRTQSLHKKLLLKQRRQRHPVVRSPHPVVPLKAEAVEEAKQPNDNCKTTTLPATTDQTVDGHIKTTLTPTLEVGEGAAIAETAVSCSITSSHTKRSSPNSTLPSLKIPSKSRNTLSSS